MMIYAANPLIDLFLGIFAVIVALVVWRLLLRK
jgi:di/tricarboxylate transporter